MAAVRRLAHVTAIVSPALSTASRLSSASATARAGALRLPKEPWMGRAMCTTPAGSAARRRGSGAPRRVAVDGDARRVRDAGDGVVARVDELDHEGVVRGPAAGVVGPSMGEIVNRSSTSAIGTATFRLSPARSVALRGG